VPHEDFSTVHAEMIREARKRGVYRPGDEGLLTFAAWRYLGKMEAGAAVRRAAAEYFRDPEGWRADMRRRRKAAAEWYRQRRLPRPADQRMG
jgi:DNA-binding PadR family transcriptional regulator